VQTYSKPVSRRALISSGFFVTLTVDSSSIPSPKMVCSMFMSY